MLILYPTTLLNLLVLRFFVGISFCSHLSLVESLGFFFYTKDHVIYKQTI